MVLHFCGRVGRRQVFLKPWKLAVIRHLAEQLCCFLGLFMCPGDDRGRGVPQAQSGEERCEWRELKANGSVARFF